MDDICVICMGEFNIPTITKCCKSIFCFECLIRALQSTGNKCPYCRNEIKSNKEYCVIQDSSVTIPTSSNAKLQKKLFDELDKLEVLEKILEEIKKDSKSRILIFSNYVETFDKINKIIEDTGLNSTVLKGDSVQISKIIDKYENGNIRVLMLDSSNYGMGLISK
jgi:ERCC4-related helicase